MSNTPPNSSKNKTYFTAAILFFCIIAVFAFSKNFLGTAPATNPDAESSSSGSSETSSQPPPYTPPESSSKPADTETEEENSQPAAELPLLTPTTPHKPAQFVIDDAGVYADAETYSEIVINAAGTTLQNKTVTGNLFVMDNVGNGDIFLENIVVEGVLYIYGGGENTVTLTNVTAPQMLLQKDSGSLGLKVCGSTSIGTTTVKCHTKLTQNALDATATGFGTLIIAPSHKVRTDISLIDISLREVITNTSSHLYLSAGAKLGALHCNAGTYISGEGIVTNLYANNSGVSFESAPQNIVLADGVVLPQSGTTPTDGALDLPKNLQIIYNGENDSFVASFDFCENAVGYEVVPYLDNIAYGNLKLTNLQNNMVILNNASSYLGRKIFFKVKALGDGKLLYDSAQISSQAFTISRLEASTPTAELNEQLAQINIAWPKVNEAENYQLIITNYSKTQPTVAHVNLGENIYTMDISNEISTNYELVFSVSAIAPPNTGMINSTFVSSTATHTAVVPMVSDLSMAQDESGDIYAQWQNPKGFDELILKLYQNNNLIKTIYLESDSTNCLILSENEARSAASSSVYYTLSASAEKGISPAPVTCTPLTLNGFLPIASSKVSLKYLTTPTSGYYAVWDELGNAARGLKYVEIIPIINGETQTPQKVLISDKKALVLAKSNFELGSSVNFSIRPIPEKVGQVMPAATKNSLPKSIAAMKPPTSTSMLLADGKVRFLYKFSEDGKANISEYEVTLYLDGTPANTYKTILNNMDFDYKSTSANEITFAVKALTYEETPLADSAQQATLYSLIKNGASITKNTTDSSCYLVLPENISGNVQISIPQLQVDKTVTINSGDKIELMVGGEYASFQESSYNITVKYVKDGISYTALMPDVKVTRSAK